MNFNDLKIWQKRLSLTIRIYEVCEKLPKQEVYGIISQLQRASSSVPANIAERFGRNGSMEFVQFLFQAKASIYETQNIFLLAKDLECLGHTQSAAPLVDYKSLAKMLNSFISKVRQNV